MTTVKQMIEWLETLPEDAEVQCGVEVRSGYDTYMEFAPVDIGWCDVFDYFGDKWVEHRHYGKVIINIRGD